jgi:pSer/pThr/pTyr-binding forkhead associated (FHA) protein
VKRSKRELPVADELWAALEALAGRLGTPVEGLVDQAVHAFLRFHGALPPDAAAGPRDAVTRRVLDAAHDLERGLHGSPGTLTLFGEGGPLATVTGERFVIGRGRHCDLVLESAKVSREHAVIRREEDGWWIEDLGSSNGTWFEKARVDRRRIQDGDEYFICAEKLRCVLSAQG